MNFKLANILENNNQKDDLNVIVQNINDKIYVSSRIIAEELGKRHTDVMRQIDNILDNENVRSLIIPNIYTVKGQNRGYSEYLLSKDGFILYMFNIQGHNDFKMAYINKFNEMEKALSSKALPSNYKEALLALIEQVEENEKLIVKNNEMKPKAIYFDRVIDSESCFTTSQIAKELGMTATKLNKILAERKIQYKIAGQWLLYKKYQNMGLTKTRTSFYSDNSKRTAHATVWTEKGRKFIHDLISELVLSTPF